MFNRRSKLYRAFVSFVTFAVVAQPALAQQRYLIQVPIVGITSKPAGDLTVSPSPAAFPTTTVGSAASPVRLKVTNNGFSAISNIAITMPSGGSDFGFSSDCPAMLPGRGSCNVTVSFTPTLTGSRTASLAVSSTAANGLQLVSVTGSGAVPDVSLTAAQVPATQVGETSPFLVTVANSSPAQVSLSPGSLADPFTVDGGTCGASVAANSSCTYRVSFAPTSTSAAAANFKVSMVAGSYGFDRTVALSAAGQAPAATLAAASFGNVAAGASKDVNAVLTNAGVGPISVGTPTVTGAGFSVVGGTCASSLAVGQTCTIAVRLTASGLTGHTGTLTVPTQAGTKTAALTGQSQQAVLAFEPATLAFGTKQTGTSTALGVTLRNNGNISTGAISLASSGAYSIASSNCGAGLAAGASCTATVTFAPSAAQGYSGSASATSGSVTTNLALSGTGQDASATLSAVNFGNVSAGSSTTADATLTNTGVGTITLGTATVSGSGFSLASGGTCGSTLSAGATCTVKVQLNATGSTAHTGTLSIATTEAGTKSSSLTGQSQQAVLAVSPASRAFGNVQVGQSVTSAAHTVTNTGNIAATGMSITAPNGFTVNAGSPACATSLAAGASCQFTLTFNPGAAQAYSGNATIASANAGSPTVAVSGAGVAQSGSITDIAFGSRAAGSTTDLTSTLSNDGVGPLSVTAPTSASVSGSGFSLVSSTCASSIAPGASCTTTIRYTASGTSAASGSLVLSTGAGSMTAALSGQSLQAVLAVTPTSDAFGTVQVGQTATSATHTLTNNGNTTATSLSITPPSGYSLTSNTCSISLANGASCSFTVSFSPSAAQSYSGNVAITASNTSTVNIAVSGSGAAQSASISDVSFGSKAAGTSTDLASTLTNTGVGPLSVTAPTAGSVSGAGFSFVSTTCGASIAAGGSCTTTVRYTASGTSSATGSLAISTGAGTKTAALSGQSLSSVATLTSAASINLSDWLQAGTITGSFTYRNDGNSSMTLNSPALTSPLSTSSNTCTAVAAGSTCTITVALTRDANNGGSGAQSFVASGAGSDPAQVTVNWAIFSVIPSWTPASLSYGNVQVGQSSVKSVTLNNSGSVAANWATNNTLTNLPAGFTADLSACSNVVPGGSCSVNITFSPTAAQAYNGSGIYPSYASKVGANTLSLSAAGVAQSASITDVAFGSRAAGSTTDLTSTLSNDGVGPLSVTAPTAGSVTGSGFSFVSTTCGTSLASGSSCTTTVRYTASGTSSATGSLAISTGAGTRTAALNGQSLLASLGVTPTSDAFGSVQVGQSATSATHTLSNSGNTPATSVSITPPSGYSITGNTCSSTLANGSSCTFTVTFTPAAAQSYPGSVSITASNSASASITVSGTGIAQSASITDIAYGSRSAGSATDLNATLTNTGSGPLSVTPPSSGSVSGAAFSFVSTTCGSSLAVGGTCTTTVRYTASGTSSASGSLSISTGAGTRVSSLSGQSLQAVLSGSTAAANFGGAYVGDSLTSGSYSVSNTGNTGITGLSIGAPSGFSITNNTCGTTLGAGSSCTYTITFAPTAAQAYSGSVSVSTSNAGSYGVSVSGTGVAKFSTATLTSASSITLADWYSSGTITGSFTYRNDGNQAMTLNSPALSSPLSVAGNSCSGIAPGSSCTITVALTRNANTGGSGSQSFTATGATNNPTSVTVNWSIYSAIPQWGTTSLAFGNVTTGGSSSQNVALYNYGSVAYNWAANNGIANQPAGFSFNMSACSNVAPNGGSCTVTVTFNPTAAQAYGGSSIYPSAASVVNNTLSVSGTGTAPLPSLSLSSTNAAFGTVSNSGPWYSGTFTLTNSGAGAATGLSVGAPANFGITSNTCAATLAAGSSCSFVISATPPSPGTYSGNTTVSSTNGGSLNIATSITLSANVSLSVSPTSAAFGSVNVGSSSSTSTHTLSATGNTTASGISISPPSGYSIVSNNCGTTLAAGSSCTFGVRFSPTAAGAYNGSVTISSTNGGSPSVSVSGTGVALVATLGVSPGSVAFGNVNTGSSSTSGTITVSNTGNTAATGMSIGAPSGYSISGSNCGTSLGAGSSCTFAITFSPTAAQSYSGNVTVSSSNGGSPTVSVSGTGVTPATATMSYVSARTVSGSAGSTGYIRGITFRNTGTATANYTGLTCTGGPWFVMNGTSGSVAPNATIEVQCQAAGSGGYTATITFTGSGITNSGTAMGPY